MERKMHSRSLNQLNMPYGRELNRRYKAGDENIFGRRRKPKHIYVYYLNKRIKRQIKSLTCIHKSVYLTVNWSDMKVIKDTPKGTPKEDMDVVSYMEDKYPEMTSEFQKIQREQYELFLHKQHDYGPQNIVLVRCW